MTRDEHIAMKIYREALSEASENDIELRYRAEEEVPYYIDDIGKETRMTMKVYNLLYKHIYVSPDEYETFAEERRIKHKYIDLIAEHIGHLDEIGNW